VGADKLLTRMLDAILRHFVKLLLGLRYRVRIRGVAPVAARGKRGILFLPNHPALIDPIIVMTWLHEPFAPRALADQDQIDRFFIRWLAQRSGVRPLPDVRRYGPAARVQAEQRLNECIEDLRRGENVLLYPSGHLYRSRYEDLRGNSAVERILRAVPDVRVVLVRTRGLWGSGFSLASGRVPDVGRFLWRCVGYLLANALFFTPRRAVEIELCEPRDFPRSADRHTINAFLEHFYNVDAPPAVYVPYTRWEGGGAREMPEPDWGRLEGLAAAVPPATQQLVLAHLREMTGLSELRPEQRLAQDLGLDSLAKAELVLWLGREFGFPSDDVDALQTVGDVLLAARGQAVVSRPAELRPPPRAWFAGRSARRVDLPMGATIPAVFLAQASRDPNRIVIADQLRGPRRYRDLVTAVFVLRPPIARLAGERVGLMLPASVAASACYLATLFAGRVPVLLNWTVGRRNMTHALDVTGVQRVLTSAALVSRLEARGVEFGSLRERFVFVEQLVGNLGWHRRALAAVRARGTWSALARAAIAPTAAVLLTSGSETVPKAVPLTHANLLANIRDILTVFTVREDDCLLGFLPPFHSFGLTVTLVFPLLTGVRVIYHPNPTEAGLLARLVHAYRATLLCGTPTFLAGVARAGSREMLSSLRLIVTGAEACPPRVYQLLAERCPQAVVLEGYGVTECSPVVAVNREDDPRPGTIGRVLPSFEYAVVNEDSGRLVSPGQVGMLLVRGPSVFSGYLGEPGVSAFVEWDGRRWYRTGDLVSEDAQGVLTFRGRLKRFVKLGGEMISLPAIEAALEPHYVADTDEGPTIAVEATPGDEHPEIVLFTTRPVDRATVNRQIRAAGLSALHNVARVVQVDQIPVLGTGKTDYRALRERLRGGLA